jgi:hypothetical protein
MREKLDTELLPSIIKTFGSVFTHYGFELQRAVTWDGHGEYSVTASKRDVALNFYLVVIPMSRFYYFSLGLQLSGKLAREATHNQESQNIDVMVIAECLDPDDQRPSMKIQTKQELQMILEREREVLLKYCKGVLEGDISIWPKVVSCVQEKRKKSSY